jgi:hypothetical protein
VVTRRKGAAATASKAPRRASFVADPAIHALQQMSGRRLLAAMMRPDLKARARSPKKTSRRLGLASSSGLDATIAAATAAVDRAEDVGLTVSLKRVRILDAKAGGFDWGRGEIYVIASILDGTGRLREHQTKIFEGIRDGDFLPLGQGGMLVGAIENPRWFLDLHMVIAESDADIRSIGKAVAKARKQSGISKVAQAVGALSKFDPTAITRVVGAADIFLATLQGLLASNGDDHIATVHDFYLKQQGFGAGRHPPGVQKLTRYQDAELAYSIDVVEI